MDASKQIKQFLKLEDLPTTLTNSMALSIPKGATYEAVVVPCRRVHLYVWNWYT